MKSRRAEGLLAHRGLDQFHRETGGSGLKGWRTPAPKHYETDKKTHFSGSYEKPPTRHPTKRAPERKMLRARETVQNRRVDLLANDSDRRSRRRRHISGEVSPRQCCHCSSILVSLRKDVGPVTAEYTGY